MTSCSHMDTVIFDLDGTLLDTLDDLTAAVNYCMERFGGPTHTRQEVRRMVGYGIYRLMQRALPGGSSHPHYRDCMDTFRPYYAAHMTESTRPYTGILPLLDALRAKNYKLAIVSNKFDAAVKHLNRHFFGDRIPVAIGENEAAGIAKKPAPDTVFAAMRQLGSEASSCLYVGDSDVDIRTAANAGIPCISAGWGFQDAAHLKENGAQTIVFTPSELQSLLSV